MVPRSDCEGKVMRCSLKKVAKVMEGIADGYTVDEAMVEAFGLKAFASWSLPECYQPAD